VTPVFAFVRLNLRECFAIRPDQVLALGGRRCVVEVPKPEPRKSCDQHTSDWFKAQKAGPKKGETGPHPGNPVIANNIELLNGSQRFIERPPNNQP